MNVDMPPTGETEGERELSLLTAYALDQASATERESVDRRLADPAAVEERAHVADVRRLAQALRAGRDAEQVSRSPDLRRAVVLASAGAARGVTAPMIAIQERRPPWIGLAVLAGGGIAAAIALLAVRSPDALFGFGPREVAVRTQPATPDGRDAAGRIATDEYASRLPPQATGRTEEMRSGPTAELTDDLGRLEAKAASASAKSAIELPPERAADRSQPPAASPAAANGVPLAARPQVDRPAAVAAAGPGPMPRSRLGESLAKNAVEDQSKIGSTMPPTGGVRGYFSDADARGGLGVGSAATARGGSGVPTRERYGEIVESPFLSPTDHPLSTFSVDVDTASYANVRRFLEAGRMPPRDAVRIEELLNYFRYDMPQPDGEEPFSVTVEAAECPWKEGRTLVRVGLQGRDIDRHRRPAGNIVFLIDVSGSMGEETKLPLVKQSLAMLVEELTENDTITIVTYAGDAGLRLPPTSGDQKGRILEAIASLATGGSTNGGAGISLAYDVAAERHIRGGVNRVILATDGDLNVGVTSNEALVDLVSSKAKEGTFLTVLGVGAGNLQDDKLEQIADHGNGIYAYIDGAREARKVLVEQLTGSTITIAKDVKIQVEFNPARVSSYRLLGYENRRLAAADFRDDRKDAGDIGAGHGVTALYEIVPVATAGDLDAEPLKYQRPGASPSPTTRLPADSSAELLTVKLRYKRPDGDVSVLREVPLADVSRPFAAASKDLRFAAAVAAFGMILRESEHRGDATLAAVADIAGSALGADVGGYRAEFLDLVRRARAILTAAGGR